MRCRNPEKHPAGEVDADDGEDADNDMIFFQPGRLAHPAKSLQPSFSELDFGKKSEENLSRALLPMPADSSAEQEDATGERRESVRNDRQ